MNPMLVDPDYHETLNALVQAFEILLSTDDDSVHYLHKILLGMSSHEFLRCVQKLQTLVTLKLLGDEDPNAAIKEAIEILDIFYAANQRRSTKLDYREFCNDAINSEVNLQDHLEEWLDQRAALRNDESFEEKFCLCNYPWILNTASKSDILVWDSKDKMKGEIDKELINNLLTNLNDQHPAQNHNFNFAYLYLEIHRENIIENTLNILVNGDLNYRKPLKIKFIGEPGVDEGGVQKEFF